MIRLISFTAAIQCFNFVQCYGTDSGEINRGENAVISPIYDAIVFNDIADIINELDSPNGNGNSLIEAFINSVESQSDENIEDLLSEYQHYLDKARKQRKQYFDKTKQLKNKVPTLRRDPYIKKKVPLDTKFESLYFANNVYSPNEAKYPQSYYNPIEVLIPLDSRNRFFIDAPQTGQNKIDSKYDDNMYTFQKVKQRVDAPPSYHYSPPKEPNMSSCYCKTNVIPCECDCAQCIVPPEMIIRNQIENRNKYHGDKESSEIFYNENIHDSSDDSFNVRIKVDIQLPKSQDFAAPKHKNRRPSLRLDNSKEIVSNSVHLPLQYLNFPVPMQIFGLNKGSKNSKMESPQSHKLLFHKKKKSKTGPNNKKHRKKIISFHNVKPELRPKIIPIFEESINITNDQTIKSNATIATEGKLTNDTKKKEPTMISSNLTNNITTISNVPNLVNETQPEENINLNVKLMVMNENVTENSSRFENNIDSGLDDTRVERNKSNSSDISENLPRRKREVSQDAKNLEPDVKLEKNNKNYEIKNSHNIKKNLRFHSLENTTKNGKFKSSNIQNNKSTKKANSKKQGHITKIPNKKSGTKIKRDGLRNGIRKSGNNDKKTKTRRLAKSDDIKAASKKKGEGNKKSGHVKTTFQRKKSSPNSKGASKTPNKKKSQAFNTKGSKLPISMDDKLKERNVRGIQKRAKPETASKTKTKRPPIMKRAINKNKAASKQEKNLFLDAQLLYWPGHDKKPVALGVIKKNITSLILDRERQKSKVNISVEVIRQNHTKALEKAVFGNVDWDDVDTIAPIFLSFVGKYITGILTMCSQTFCHSMNCANKVCVHRICVAKDRVNNGHCIGDNGTESAVSLESIMDLPSNIPFSVVDILQDKMLGKLFGKITICISSKCVTLAVAKMTFIKMKCSTKELNSGHCPNVKKV